MIEVNQLCGQLYLGKQGENLARIVYFDEPDIWKNEFGEGVCELLHQRNGDSAPYPVKLEKENDRICWIITNADTAIVGDGKCELRYIVNDVVIKSKIWTTSVLESLGDNVAEAPEPQKAWVDEVLNAADDVKDATVHPPIIGENNNWWLWNFEASEYVDSGVKATDEDRIKEMTEPIKEDIIKINNTLNQHIESSKIYATASSNTPIYDVNRNADNNGIEKVNFYGYTSQETGATLKTPKPLKYPTSITRCTIGSYYENYKQTLTLPDNVQLKYPFLAVNDYKDSGWYDFKTKKIHYKTIIKKVVLNGTETGSLPIWYKASYPEGRYFANLHRIPGVFTDEDLSRIQNDIRIAYNDAKCSIGSEYYDTDAYGDFQESGQFALKQGMSSGVGFFRFEFFAPEFSTLNEVLNELKRKPVTLLIPMIYDVRTYTFEYDLAKMIKSYNRYNPLSLYFGGYTTSGQFVQIPTEVTYQLDVGLAIQNLKNAVNASQGGE